MQRRDPAVYLEDIERYAAAAIRYMSGVTLDEYLVNDEKRAAVERTLEVAGEALNKLAQSAPQLADRIPSYRSIIAFRNILAHGYAELDHVQVYELATFKAPDLLTAVRVLLKELDGAKDQ
jgi:uncharacterized protein with HEPN domain